MAIDGESTRTDVDGHFRLHATVPYDLAFAVNTNGTPNVGVFRGLTRLNPTLFAESDLQAIALGGSRARTNNARIKGALTGGAAAPLPSGLKTEVAFDAPNSGASSTVASDAASYELSANWDGAGELSATLHALQWTTDSSGLPASYGGYARKPGVTVANGSTVTGQDLAFDAVLTDTFGGNVVKPGVTLLALKIFELQVGDGRFLLGEQMIDTNNPLNPLPSAFSFPVPHLTGATMTSIAAAVTFTLNIADMGISMLVMRNLPTSSSGVVMQLPTAPAATAPAKGAIGVDTGTQFTWGSASGLKLVTVSTAIELPIGQTIGTSVPGAPAYTIITSDGSTTIPDLSAIGVSLPATTMYQWNVAGVAEVTTVDAVTAADAASVFTSAETLTMGISATRAFTTR